MMDLSKGSDGVMTKVETDIERLNGVLAMNICFKSMESVWQQWP